jgi:hypothetical protein
MWDVGCGMWDVGKREKQAAIKYERQYLAKRNEKTKTKRTKHIQLVLIKLSSVNPSLFLRLDYVEDRGIFLIYTFLDDNFHMISFLLYLCVYCIDYSQI